MMQQWAAVAVIERDGLVAMVRRRDGSGWGLPGGKVEPGETPRDAVVREVAEETGLRVEVGDCVLVGPVGKVTVWAY